jgi:hypothetical protein
MTGITTLAGFAVQACCVGGGYIGMTLLAFFVGECQAGYQRQGSCQQGHFKTAFLHCVSSLFNYRSLLLDDCWEYTCLKI